MQDVTYHAGIIKSGETYIGRVANVEHLEIYGEDFADCHRTLKTALALYNSVLIEQDRSGSHKPGYSLITTYKDSTVKKRALIVNRTDLLLDFLIQILTSLDHGEITYTSNLRDAKTQLKGGRYETVVSSTIYPRVIDDGKNMDNIWIELYVEVQREQSNSVFILYPVVYKIDTSSYKNPEVLCIEGEPIDLDELKERFRQIFQ